METPETADDESIFDCFSLIDDPRAANASHPLVDVLVCLIVAVCCGADGFVQAEEIAKQRKDFIKKYVPLRRGVPSHDTMAYVLSSIDPEEFLITFVMFMERLSGKPRRDIINLDGKSLRGVVGAKNYANPDAVKDHTHIVSAFSAVRGVVIGQMRSGKGVNEVHAAQELLQMIDVKGAVVTFDAAHTGVATLDIVAARKADAVFAVKGNSAALHADIVKAFGEGRPKKLETAEKTHGTIETRLYEFLPASGEAVESRFKTLKTFVRVTRDDVSHASRARQQTSETYYAATLVNVERIAECIRKRWAIENNLHCVLDIAFDEDRSRIRKKHAAENFSRVRHIAFNLLHMKKTPRKLSVALKRIRAAMDDRFLTSLLHLPARP